VTPAVVLIALVCAVTGTIVGSTKGHAVWGFFLGLLLSVIGIAIIAVTKPSAEYQVKKATARLAAEREAQRRLGGQ
jgi:cyanate permease